VVDKFALWRVCNGRQIDYKVLGYVPVGVYSVVLRFEAIPVCGREEE